MSQTNSGETPASARETVALIMLITVAGKVLGLLREIKTGSLLGVSGAAAAFNLATAIPRNLLDLTFAAAISGCFIPVFNTEFEKRGKRRAFEFANAFLSAALVVSLCFTVCLMAAAGPLSRLLAPGAAPETRALAARLFIITMPVIVISSCAFTLAGLAQSLGEFLAPAAMSVFSNGVIIVYCLFFFERFGVTGLAAAFTLGWLPQLLTMLPALFRAGFRFKFSLDISGGAFAAVKKMAPYAIVGGWVAPINDIVNISVSTSVSEGASVAYSKANTLFSIITGVLVLSALNYVFPKLTKISVTSGKDAFAQTLGSVINSLFYFLAPLTAGLFLLSGDLCAAVFQTGAFNEAAAAQTAAALKFFAAGCCGFGLTSVLNRALYARKNVIVPLVAGVCGFLTNAGLALALKGPLGARAMPLALSVSTTLSGVLALFYCKAEKTVTFGENTARDCAAVVFSSFVTALVVVFSPKPFGVGGRAQTLFNLGFVTALSLAAYFALTLCLGVAEAKNTVLFIKGLLYARKEKKMDAK